MGRRNGRKMYTNSKINDLTDINTTGIQDKQTLVYGNSDKHMTGSIPENLNDLVLLYIPF